MFPTLLLGAGILHAQAPAGHISRALAGLVVEHLIAEFNEYVFPDRAKEVQAYLQAHEQDYEAIADPRQLADKLTADIRYVGHDQHLTVVYSELSSEQNGLADPSVRDTMHRIEEASGLGVRGVTRLPGNIGLLDVAYFSDDPEAASVLGEGTGGGANPAAATHALGAHFEAFIPNGEALNPITHSNWEGTGVRPDVPVSADLSLLEAYTRALKTGKPAVSAAHLERARQKALADPASALRDAGFSAGLLAPTTKSSKD